MLRFVLANEAAVRTVMGLSLLRSVEGEAGLSEARAMRPRRRIELIDAALRPFTRTIGGDQLRRLRLSLCAVIGSEILVALKDNCDSENEEVIEIAVWMARAAAEAALAPPPIRRTKR